MRPSIWWRGRGDPQSSLERREGGGTTTDDRTRCLLHGREPGGLLDREAIDGHGGGLFTGIGPYLDYDTRDNAFYPSCGSFLVLLARTAHETIGSDLDYELYWADLRHYFSIREQQILAFQLTGTQRTGDVPFDDLAHSGGDSPVRRFSASETCRTGGKSSKRGHSRQQAAAGSDSPWSHGRRSTSGSISGQASTGMGSTSSGWRPSDRPAAYPRYRSGSIACFCRI